MDVLQFFLLGGYSLIFFFFFLTLYFQIGLPLQFEDFFVLRLGKIDTRAAYHNHHQIWPVGYRSIWHDKITGSLFQCEVSDGGDSGPVFRVRRGPCSTSLIPSGETILLYNKAKKVENAERIESSSMMFDASTKEEDDILMLLADPTPLEQELLSCFGNDIGHAYASSVRMDIDKTDGGLGTPERSVVPSDKDSSLRDVIGEFYVEGRTSSSVWKMVSRTLLDTCYEMFKQSGCLKFCCSHQCGSSYPDGEILKDTQNIGSLARFYCASGPIEIPRMIQSDIELEASFRSLTTWLEQDRFGLDTGFVQEIIETIPASRACSQYQFLIDRSDFPLSCTVGSGLLSAMQKNGERAGEEVCNGLYSRKNGSKLQDLPEDPPSADVRPPPGRPLSSKLPGELVGDVFQVQYRIYQIIFV